ncbi:class I SAM-dependent methyltransferase [Zhihengliuella salsuginis]|uniref:Methyltransferase n=1 Tax=Zhihengliuella salsuginis TaxID=578222 RepID=A0ABQ3GH49_9MICC|nr:methyltransferase domain-containing protein [Zhihengliuella salsuginis]GHD04877.1 methyltransferase [Zhihengliuella salsuginis]
MTAHYDSFAEAYVAENETSILNAYYERPAMLDLAGDVAGRRILDAGCGAGPLSEALRERGAEVAGFDASAAMIELARQRLGQGADLRVADLGDPLPYVDGEFDDVVASLVLHYLRDWGPPLAELHRVLAPGGRLILSVNHPFAFHLSTGGSYFPVAEWPMEVELAGHQAVLNTWHRPLQAMTEAFSAAGFRIASVSEPPIAPDTPEARVESELGGRRRFVSFIFFVLEAAA